MQYFEASTLHEVLPAWGKAALGLGYQWRNFSNNNRRKIGLLSMPCESEAAGLIALGALRSGLEHPTANHVDTYYELLLWARSKRQTILRRGADPYKSASWDLRNVEDNTRWRFAIGHNSSDEIVVEDSAYRQHIKRKGHLVSNPNGPCRRYITRQTALNWQLHDLPLPKLPQQGGMALDRQIYDALPNCSGPILDDNLSRSYDGLVLVGQGAARDTTYMQKFYTSGFVREGLRLPLGELLTLHRTERNYIQRLQFLNERAGEESGHGASLVIADGIPALLTAERLFRGSDVIGVCSRDASAETNDLLRSWLNQVIRYYNTLDTNSSLHDTVMPNGMLLRVLERKAE